MKAAPPLARAYWPLRVCIRGRRFPALISFKLLTSLAVADRDELKLVQIVSINQVNEKQICPKPRSSGRAIRGTQSGSWERPLLSSTTRQGKERDVAEKKRRDSAVEQKRPRVKPSRLRIRIVSVCHLRDVTPKEIATEERLPVATVQYYFNALERERWIHVSRREPVGNGVRNWYRADRLKIVYDREFEQMNERERSETSEGVLMHYLRICELALKQGTLDARPDSQLSQTLMGLDRTGWEDIQKEMDLWLERSLEIMVEAEMRLRESGGEPIPTVIHLGGFEVPRSVFEGASVPQE